jgi:hypothetical protein
VYWMGLVRTGNKLIFSNRNLRPKAKLTDVSFSVDSTSFIAKIMSTHKNKKSVNFMFALNRHSEV